MSTPTIDRPLKPVADVFMFIEDKKGDYKKKYPTMDDNELRRFMVKEFNCISERDKVRHCNHHVNDANDDDDSDSDDDDDGDDRISLLELQRR